MPHPASVQHGLPPKRSTIALACTLAMLGAAGTANAQTLDNVVVSASRAEQSSFDAPAALDSVSRDVIESAGPQVNLSESLNRVPGLTILNRQNYAQDLQLSIRGFGSRATFGIRGIRLLIDGIPATTPDGQAQGSSIALTSTDRIEVLRGPLAQLYGNAAGGVIQAWTRDAPETPEANLQLHAGSFGMLRTVWQLGGQVGDVGVVADYSTFDTDGFRDNSKTQRRQFNSKVTFGPSEQTRVTLVANVFDMPLAQDPLGLTATQLNSDPSGAGTNAIARKVRKITSQSQVGGAVTHAIDKLRSITARAYTGTRENLQFQNTGNWVSLDRNYYGVGLQYNAQSNFGNIPVNWVAGYEYDRSSERRQAGATQGDNGLVQLAPTRDEDNIANNSDFFFQGTASLSEQWSLTGGFRHSSVKFKSRDFYTLNGDPDGSGSVSYSATNPVIGLTWHASDALNVYANVGRGLETPTLAELAYIDNGSVLVPTFNTNLAAARSRHLEIGTKWTPSNQTRMDLAIFNVKTTNEIVTSISDGASSFKNAPGTERTGLELTARNMFSQQWMASLAATVMDAKFSERFTTNGSPVLAGNKLPGIPQHFLFGELLWTAQGHSNGKAKSGLQAGIEVISAGKLHVNDVNRDTIGATDTKASGYTIFNLKASHTWSIGNSNLTAYARVDNMTDREYVGSVIVNQSFRRFYEPAPGRNWTVGLRLNVPL